MRILIINQPFWPDVVATAQHLADWTEQLVTQGHQVTVIASRSVYGKQGAVLPKSELYKGVHVYRVGANLFKKGRIITRLVDFGMFHLLALARAMALPRQDVVVCLTTPPFIGVVGMLLKNIRGTRFVQYEMDLYPDVPVALGMMKPTSLLTKLFEGIHRKVLRSADRVVVLGRCMARVISAKGISEKKQVLVTPWADPQELQPVDRATNPFRLLHGLGDATVVMYSGNLGLGHDITTIMGAVEKLAASEVATDRSVRFVFVGGGKRMQEVKKIVADKELANVLMLDYQPREKLAEALSGADIHLITQGTGMSGLIVPSKFYGILAAGRPSVYIGPPDTEIAEAIMENEVGRVLAIGNVDGLIAAVRELTLPGMEVRTREVLREKYSRLVNTAKLTAMVEGLARRA